jgi:heme-degrading monooxygenase HmoA
MSDKMVELAKVQDGFLGMESAREELGITVSYWRNLEAIKQWKNNIEHTVARELGRKQWYSAFKTRISKVERDYDFFRK